MGYEFIRNAKVWVAKLCQFTKLSTHQTFPLYGIYTLLSNREVVGKKCQARKVQWKYWLYKFGLDFVYCYYVYITYVGGCGYVWYS